MADVTERTVTEQVKHHAQTVAEDTREKVEARIKGEAEAAFDSVANQMHRHASAADAAAAEFDPNSMQAQAIEQVAARIDDLANQVRNTDIDRLAHSLSDAARRNPLLFVAGATLAGFAATRFLKARDPEPRYAHPSDDPWARDTVPPNSAPTIVGGNHVSADPTSRGAV